MARQCGYSRAAALITERGATLSHGAIVAREFGIPAVVNVGGCISRLLSGQVLEVGGSKGAVTLTHQRRMIYLQVQRA